MYFMSCYKMFLTTTINIKIGSFQKVIKSYFFYETNPESSSQHQDGIKKKSRGKGSFQKPIVTTGEIWVSFINKNRLW